MNKSDFVHQVKECISTCDSPTGLLTAVNPLLWDTLQSKVCSAYRSSHAANRVSVSPKANGVGYQLTEITGTLVQEGKDGTRNCFSCGNLITIISR